MLKTKEYWLYTLLIAISIIAILAVVSATMYIEPLRIAFGNATGVGIILVPFKYLWHGWLLGLLTLSPIGGALIYGLAEE